MANIKVYLISSIQIFGDIACVLISSALAKSNKHHRVFYLINCLSFIALTFSDVYYNYLYRILKQDILLSARFLETLPLLTFQLLQACLWYRLLKQQTNLLSWLNLPYLLLAAIVVIILGYFFYITSSLSIVSTVEDICTVLLDMSIWVFTIITLGRTKSDAIALLALGCLMIVSSDLTFTCLCMFDMKNVAVTSWPHVIWAAGIVLMALGLVKLRNPQNYSFHDPNSIHAKCKWWLLMTSLIAFLIGLLLPFFFLESKKLYAIRYALWDVPISLMFTMMVSTLFSNRFSQVILSPIQLFSQSIEYFNMAKQPEIQINSGINEFKVLGEFIKKSFSEVSGRLEQEVKISTQVAHDVRSPLSALEVGIQSLPATLDESKKILLRDAVQHIRDITNILDKSDSCNDTSETKSPTQLAVLLDNVISERRLALSRCGVKLVGFYESDQYGYFSDVVPSTLKRILTNVLNNSYEAIENKDGFISVNLYEENGICTISIKDNGCGISDMDFKSLFKRGFSTKKEGRGLGLFHAKEILAAWGGEIKITSVLSEGTEVAIKIPLIKQPLWFISKLSLCKEESVVCIDDSLSVYQSWLERFKSFNDDIKLIHYPSKESFTVELELLRHQSVTYLIDYEFPGKSYNGCDLSNLILMLGNRKNRIFMVTSRSGEKDVQKYCAINNIHIIPKNFSVKIPLQIFDKNKKTVILSEVGEQEVFLLDSSKYHVYTSVNDFTADMAYFDSSCQIFIHKSIDRSCVEGHLNLHGLHAMQFNKISDLVAM